MKLSCFLLLASIFSQGNAVSQSTDPTIQGLAAEVKARGLKIDVDALRDLPNVMDRAAAAQNLDADGLIEEFLDKLLEGFPQFEEIITAIQEILEDGFDFQALIDMIESIIKGEALDPETAQELAARTSKGSLPLVMTVPGLANKVKAIEDRFQDDAILKTILDTILSSLPQAEKIIEVIDTITTEGFQLADLIPILQDLLAGSLPSESDLEKLKEHLSGPLPVVFTVEGLKDLLENIASDLLEDLENLLDRTDITNFEELLRVLRDAVKNGMPQDLQTILVEAISKGQRLSSEQASSIEAYAQTDLPVSIKQEEIATGQNDDSDIGLKLVAGVVVGVIGLAGAVIYVRRLSNQKESSNGQLAGSYGGHPYDDDEELGSEEQDFTDFSPEQHNAVLAEQLKMFGHSEDSEEFAMANVRGPEVKITDDDL